ncbi:pleckstrin domain-containing protein [Heterostelium album PN500]|uniref:Pleckstrin domain-containing protein n=1 Tax=Heterostelium pallidum (strain ATCC 26659 / Pp 5 / PN500) TaxID=670386 RepID=D3B1X5_HETP5|nr:pleckstrin domain-containing protein [Heterostelium album PN500]EFA85299.1 pleckstrin domain-containing protein [Heterostelium album PN500]|eukprot:XP_020437408.1 pleckstrin domain-containing protein [Heterostelium album PN500]
MDAQLKQDLVDLTKAILATFTAEYTKAYTVALTAKCVKDAKKPPSPYLLSVREKPLTGDRHSGFLTKEGAVRKSLKRRYFIVRQDYSIDYYESENNLTKKKGTITLAGYKVETDPNKSILGRLTKLAEKMKMDVSAIPKPKEYPPFTIELLHEYRRIYYLTADNKEQFDEWTEVLKTCVRHAQGFKNPDAVHQKAFGVAVRNTRWSLGRWGWFGWGGSEVQVLADVISDEVEYDILNRALYKLPSAPWFIRNFLRTQMMKVIIGTVTSAVNPAWIAMDKTVTGVRPTAEGKIREEIDPIAKLQQEMLDKMKDQLISVIEPVVREQVSPHLSTILGDEVKKPLEKSFVAVVQIWNEQSAKYNGDGSDKSFTDLRKYPQYFSPMRSAHDPINELYPFLQTLYPVFDGFWASTIVYGIRGELNQISENAVYTFEKEITESSNDGAVINIDSARQSILSKLEHDAKILYRDQLHFTVRSIVKPTLMKILNPLTKPILSNLQSMIPAALKDFFDMNEMFHQILDGVLDNTTDTVLEN